MSSACRRCAASRLWPASRSALPSTTVSRLLKSWATPPVSWPTASSRCACDSWACSASMSLRWACNAAAAWFSAAASVPSSPRGSGPSTRACRSPLARRPAMPVMRAMGRRITRSAIHHTDRNSTAAKAAYHAASRRKRWSAAATMVASGAPASTRRPAGASARTSARAQTCRLPSGITTSVVPASREAAANRPSGVLPSCMPPCRSVPSAGDTASTWPLSLSSSRRWPAAGCTAGRMARARSSEASNTKRRPASGALTG